MIGRCAVAVAALLALAPGHAAADEDSPWPEHGSSAAQIRAVRSVVGGLERKVALMEWSAARYADWSACVRRVPVSEYGDPDRQFGYAYDEGDGTGPGFMPALAVDRTSRAGKEDYLFLAFRRDAGCRSHAPAPGGTAEPAAAGRRGTLRSLERRVRRLKRSARRLEATAQRFDAWESCVSQVPVTEYGDPDGGFGYLFGRAGATSFAYRPALAIDRSDWDDPDYMFLAFVGGDRPGGTCQNEPGEAVD
jgi:hypothetical protein